MSVAITIQLSKTSSIIIFCVKFDRFIDRESSKILFVPVVTMAKFLYVKSIAYLRKSGNMHSFGNLMTYRTRYFQLQLFNFNLSVATDSHTEELWMEKKELLLCG